MTSVVAFGAHPDDVEIFAGGTVAALSRLGTQVTIVHLTRGEAGTRGNVRQRMDEAARAAGILGVGLRILDLEDGRLCDDDRSRGIILRLIRELRPDILLAPYAEDDHPDHVSAGRLLKSAWFLAGLRKLENDLPPHLPRFYWSYFSHEFAPPSFLVRLTREDMDRFIGAVRAYGSQLHDPTSSEPATRLSDPSFLKALESRRRFFGSLVGAEFAEPWWSAKPVLLSDPTALLH